MYSFLPGLINRIKKNIINYPSQFASGTRHVAHAVEDIREDDCQYAIGAGRIQAAVQQIGRGQPNASRVFGGHRGVQGDHRRTAAAAGRAEEEQRQAGGGQAADDAESGVDRKHVQK